MARFDLRANSTSHQVEGASDDSLLSILRYGLGFDGQQIAFGAVGRDHYRTAARPAVCLELAHDAKEHDLSLV
jgi:hypothetical protein